MRFNLRSIILTSAVMAAAAALATTSAMAEAIVTVPFSFTAAGKTCPAGRYIVLKDTGHNFVMLRGKDAPVSFQWLLQVGDDSRKSSEITLRFDGQDKSYALESVQYGRMTTHRLDKTSPHSEHKTVLSATGE
ncbi:hypothetical protein [Acidicapsa acidisoli]|uniref:hypothetical protein n=1 Tax=Acidicapsa acidisoli TaxID=1615681 RepID=UPI0021E003A7|nr:hypothetical protein [Acidicapsa acidisoli]